MGTSLSPSPEPQNAPSLNCFHNTMNNDPFYMLTWMERLLRSQDNTCCPDYGGLKPSGSHGSSHAHSLSLSGWASLQSHVSGVLSVLMLEKDRQRGRHSSLQFHDACDPECQPPGATVTVSEGHAHTRVLTCE